MYVEIQWERKEENPKSNHIVFDNGNGKHGEGKLLQVISIEFSQFPASLLPREILFLGVFLGLQ
jgi:hypothetical protein